MHTSLPNLDGVTALLTAATISLGLGTFANEVRLHDIAQILSCAAVMMSSAAAIWAKQKPSRKPRVKRVKPVEPVTT